MLQDKYVRIFLDEKNKKEFIIEVDKEGFSINILFDWKEKFKLDNIFLILKSYINNKQFLIKGIYVIGNNKDFLKDNIKPNFFRNIDIKKIEKMNFFDFNLFYEEMFENDWQLYLNNFDYYGFRIVFMKESKIWEEKKYYVNYPWEKNFKINYINNTINNNELHKLKKTILILKKKIKYSLYRHVRRRKR